MSTTKTAKPTGDAPVTPDTGNGTRNATELAGMTDYIVYRAGAGMNPPATNTLTEIGRVAARNDRAAVKAKHTGNGQYVAIAAKFVKPVTVKIETVEQVNLS